jgi:hypothetical protein
MLRVIAKTSARKKTLKQRNAETRAVVSVIKQTFPRAEAEAYRYAVGSIRLRVIDTSFRGKRPFERIRMVSEALKPLPEKTQSEIIYIVPITPVEHRDKVYGDDYDFDHPLPPQPIIWPSKLKPRHWTPRRIHKVS